VLGRRWPSGLLRPRAGMCPYRSIGGPGRGDGAEHDAAAAALFTARRWRRMARETPAPTTAAALRRRA